MDPISLVDQFIDTGKERVRWVFTVFTARPFGMVRLGPNTDPEGTWNSGYRYGSPRIKCFSHIHSWQLAGIPMMPVPGAAAPSADYDNYASAYSHADEEAEPGYYHVRLDDHDIDAKLYATDRVGAHHYTFAGRSEGSVVMNLGGELGPCKMSDVSIERVGNSEVAGFVENDTTTRRNKRCRIYFVVAFDREIRAMVATTADAEPQTTRRATGAGTSVALQFDVGGSHELRAKVGISYVSVENARMNLNTELPHWDFRRVHRESHDIWNAALGTIRVRGGSEEAQVKFYTDLWRTLVAGHMGADVDGSYCDLTGDKPVIRTVAKDEAGRPVHPLVSGQDGYWNAQWSLATVYGLAYPRAASHYVNQLVTMYQDGGLVPRGPSGNSYTFVMIAAPTTPFIVSAYQKGIRDFDVEAAYQGLRKNAFPGGLMSKAGYEFDTATGGGVEYYIDRGYIPAHRAGGGMHVDGAAQTMEYSYQDWSLAQFAKALGKGGDVDLFSKRAGNFKNLFDRQTGFIRPRTESGDWLDPFDPLSLEDFCEANSWQYTWHAVHDLGGLAALMGGRGAVVEKLIYGFEQAEATDFYAPKPETRRDTAYVNYGNEPGRFVAHLFNHLGEPWLAQKWARKVRNQTFGKVSPYGFFEDDDNGKAAATSLLLALGLFDVTGGVTADPVYEITAPVFQSVEIDLDSNYYSGGTFTIEVSGNPTDHPYIQSAELDGRPVTTPFIRHADVVAGGRLLIQLSPEPNRSWGR